MKYQEVRTGDTFSLCGQLLTLKGIEHDTAILKDVRSGKVIVHGLDALRHTVKQFGYLIINEVKA